MASPVDSARQGTNITTAATSHAINVGSPVAGTLLIVFVRFAGAPGTVTFTGYTQFAADTSDASDDDTRLYYRQADGSEGATDTLSTVNSIKLAAICWEITGAENPATTAPSVSTVAIGTAANIDPTSVSFGIGDGTLALDYLTAGSPTGGWIFGSTGTSQQRAQSFDATGNVIKVGLSLFKDATPTDNVVVEIRADDGAGKPSATVIGSSATVAGSSLTSSPATYEFRVEAATVSGTKYWIVMRRDGSLDATNRYEVRDTGSDVYSSNGISAYNGTSWGTVQAIDGRFATYEGAIPEALFLTVVGLDSETATFTSPSGYSTATTANSGTGGAVATNCMIAGASKQATAGSENPGAWTSSAPNSGVTAWTIAIRAPAAAAAPGPAAAMFKPPARRRASRFLTFR